METGARPHRDSPLSMTGRCTWPTAKAERCVIIIIRYTFMCCFSKPDHRANYKTKNKTVKTNLREYAGVRAHARAHTHKHAHTHTRARTHTHARTHARTHAHTHARTHAVSQLDILKRLYLAGWFVNCHE